VGALQHTAVAALVAFLCLPTSGCLVVSLFPLYDEASVECEPAIVGSWRNEDDRISLDVVAAQWRSYAVTWREASGTYKGHAYLTRIGGDLFADVTAPPGEDRGPVIVVVHGWCRVRLAGERLLVEALDYESLASPTQRRLAPGAIFDERDNILLTGDTASLRRWLTRTGRRPGVYAAPVVFTRVSPR
jgi:hypothetical protein